MPKSDEDPITWRDLMNVRDDIRQLDMRIGKLETGYGWMVKKMEELNDEVHKLRWWIVGSIIGSTLLTLVIRLLTGT